MGTLHTEKKYLLVLSIFVHGVEGEEATSPSFVSENAAIDASSSLLEAFIATQYMERGWDGSTLPTANKMTICRSLIVYKQEGQRGNVSLLYS